MFQSVFEHLQFHHSLRQLHVNETFLKCLPDSRWRAPKSTVVAILSKKGRNNLSQSIMRTASSLADHLLFLLQILFVLPVRYL